MRSVGRNDPCENTPMTGTVVGEFAIGDPSYPFEPDSSSVNAYVDVPGVSRDGGGGEIAELDATDRPSIGQ